MIVAEVPGGSGIVFSEGLKLIEIPVKGVGNVRAEGTQRDESDRDCDECAEDDLTIAAARQKETEEDEWIELGGGSKTETDGCPCIMTAIEAPEAEGDNDPDEDFCVAALQKVQIGIGSDRNTQCYERSSWSRKSSLSQNLEEAKGEEDTGSKKEYEKSPEGMRSSVESLDRQHHRRGVHEVFEPVEECLRAEQVETLPEDEEVSQGGSGTKQAGEGIGKSKVQPARN